MSKSSVGGERDQQSKSALPVAVEPTFTPENEAFWHGTEEGRFVAEGCCSCGLKYFPATGVCRRCGSREVEPRDVVGRGVVYAYTVNHQTWMDGMSDPFGLALVTFPDDDGIRLLGWVAPEDTATIAIGDV